MVGVSTLFWMGAPRLVYVRISLMPDPHRQLRFALGRYTLDERIGPWRDGGGLRASLTGS